MCVVDDVMAQTPELFLLFFHESYLKKNNYIYNSKMLIIATRVYKRNKPSGGGGTKTRDVSLTFNTQ